MMLLDLTKFTSKVQPAGLLVDDGKASNSEDEENDEDDDDEIGELPCNLCINHVDSVIFKKPRSGPGATATETSESTGFGSSIMNMLAQSSTSMLTTVTGGQENSNGSQNKVAPWGAELKAFVRLEPPDDIVFGRSDKKIRYTLKSLITSELFRLQNQNPPLVEDDITQRINIYNKAVWSVFRELKDPDLWDEENHTINNSNANTTATEVVTSITQPIPVTSTATQSKTLPLIASTASSAGASKSPTSTPRDSNNSSNFSKRLMDHLPDISSIRGHNNNASIINDNSINNHGNSQIKTDDMNASNNASAFPTDILIPISPSTNGTRPNQLSSTPRQNSFTQRVFGNISDLSSYRSSSGAGSSHKQKNKQHLPAYLTLPSDIVLQSHSKHVELLKSMVTKEFDSLKLTNEISPVLAPSASTPSLSLFPSLMMSPRSTIHTNNNNSISSNKGSNSSNSSAVTTPRSAVLFSSSSRHIQRDKYEFYMTIFASGVWAAFKAWRKLASFERLKANQIEHQHLDDWIEIPLRNAILLPEFADADYFNNSNDDTTPRNSDSESDGDDEEDENNNSKNDNISYQKETDNNSSSDRVKMSFQRQKKAYTKDLFTGHLYTSRIPRDLSNKFSHVRENLEQQLVKKQITTVFLFAMDNREFLQLQAADLVNLYTARGIKVFCCSALDILIPGHTGSGAGSSITTAREDDKLSARLAIARSNASSGDTGNRNAMATTNYKSQTIINDSIADVNRHINELLIRLMRGENCLLHCPTGLSSCGVFAAYFLNQIGLSHEISSDDGIHHGTNSDHLGSYVNSDSYSNNAITSVGLVMLRREASPLYVETENQERALSMLMAAQLKRTGIDSSDNTHISSCNSTNIHSLITQTRPDYVQLVACYKVFVSERIAERLRPRVPFSRSPSRRQSTKKSTKELNDNDGYDEIQET